MESSPKQSSPNPGATSFYDLKPLTLLGDTADLTAYRGKVTLVVNVASKCGFTTQYDGLEKLYEKYKDRGLVVLGAPCNQFGGQEPGKPEEIASFCRLTYGVSFPMLAKQDVNGPAQSALFKWLIGSPAGASSSVKWNFEKFLIGRDGNVIGRWRSVTTPDSGELVGAIEAALGVGG